MSVTVFSNEREPRSDQPAGAARSQHNGAGAAAHEPNGPSAQLEIQPPRAAREEEGPKVWAGRKLPIRLNHTFTLLDMMWLVIASAVVFRLVFVLRIQSLILLALLVPGVIVGYVVALVARRSTQQESILWVLAVAAEKRMPLAPGIHAVAEQYSGLLGRQAKALASWLEAGLLLPEALERLPGLLPRWCMTLVRVGSESGVLSAALREAAEIRSVRPGPKHPVLGKIGYLVGVLFFIQTIVAFLLIYVLPKFTVILRDFGVPLPWPTVLVTQVTRAIAQNWLLPIVFLGEFTFLVCLLLHFAGTLPVRLPMVDRLARRRHTALILRALAIVIENDQPLTPALKTLSRAYPQRWVRRRLARAHYATAEGAKWYECLRTQQLLTAAEATALASAERAGNLPWAMREVAESGERRLVFRLQAFSQILFVVVVLALGIVVFLLAVAYFMPILSLLEAMVNSI